MNEELISIRPIEMKDAKIVLGWENNPGNWAYGDTDCEYSLIDIVKLVEDLQDVHVAKQARWMIISDKQEDPIGAIDLFEMNFSKNEAGVGILIAESENRNKGFASKALDCLEKEAKKLDVRLLKCTVHNSNQQSIRLFEKNGFVKKGERNEFYRFGHRKRDLKNG